MYNWSRLVWSYIKEGGATEDLDSGSDSEESSEVMRRRNKKN